MSIKESPLHVRVGHLSDLLTNMVKSLVENSDEVRVVVDSNIRRVMFSVYVADTTDKALLIGREGSHANAMRTIVQAAARKLSLRCDVDLYLLDEMERDAPVEPVDKGHRTPRG